MHSWVDPGLHAAGVPCCSEPVPPCRAAKCACAQQSLEVLCRNAVCPMSSREARMGQQRVWRVRAWCRSRWPSPGPCEGVHPSLEPRPLAQHPPMTKMTVGLGTPGPAASSGCLLLVEGSPPRTCWLVLGCDSAASLIFSEAYRLRDRPPVFK